MSMSSETREVNVPLLRKAVEWAEAEAAKPKEESRWNQRLWVTYLTKAGNPIRRDDSTVVKGIAQGKACGTAYCIAGWVGAMTDPMYERTVNGWAWDLEKNTHLRDENHDMYEHVSEYAEKELGLTPEQATELFSATNKIEDVRRIAERIAGEKL